MTKVLEVEPCVDETLKLLVGKLDKLFARDGKVCKMDDWLGACWTVLFADAVD